MLDVVGLKILKIGNFRDGGCKFFFEICVYKNYVYIKVVICCFVNLKGDCFWCLVFSFLEYVSICIYNDWVVLLKTILTV